jgi:hypothetical protein
MNRITAIILAAMAIVSFSGMAMAASLQVGIASIEGASGSTTKVPVTVSGANNLGSMDFLVSYDSSVLVAQGVEKGSLNKGMISANTTVPGLISVSIADSGGMTGTGDVAVILFAVNGSAGATSPLALANVQAYDAGTFLDVPLTLSDGTFTVVAGSSGGTGGGDNSMLLIGGGVAALLAVAVLLAAIMMLRKKK